MGLWHQIWGVNVIVGNRNEKKCPIRGLLQNYAALANPTAFLPRSYTVK